jgi:hypothetical protein
MDPKSDDQGGHDGTADESRDEIDLERRHALGRLALYTAPVMLGLLLSEPAASATLFT